MSERIDTKRLSLVACDTGILTAALHGDEALATYLDINIAHRWTEFGKPALKYTLEKLLIDPRQAYWWTYLPILKQTNTLIGSCGYKGSPDESGTVEIGYEVAADYRNLGLATEIAGALIQHAMAQPEVRLVIAHTLAEPNASVRVLEKCGMKKAGSVLITEEGSVWRWEIKIPETGEQD